MFNLEKEIDLWCHSIRMSGWNRASQIAELKDHLYCEIEQFSKDGLSDEEAFKAATARLGDVTELSREHSKNRSVLSVVFEFLVTGSLNSGAEHTVDGRPNVLKRLQPTITTAFGALIGGLLGSAVGSLLGRESITIAAYATGFLLGAVAGGLVGLRVRSRQALG